MMMNAASWPLKWTLQKQRPVDATQCKSSKFQCDDMFVKSKFPCQNMFEKPLGASHMLRKPIIISHLINQLYFNLTYQFIICLCRICLTQQLILLRYHKTRSKKNKIYIFIGKHRSDVWFRFHYDISACLIKLMDNLSYTYW